MSALFNFHSFLNVVLLVICTCTYIKMQFPAILEHRTGLRRCRNTVIFSLSVVLLTLLPIAYYRTGARSNSQFELQLQPSLGFMNGTDLIWKVPKSPIATLFIAHGCGGRASNFWDRSSSCPNCAGMPEERLLVLHALDRKFAVLTISSIRKCWSFGKEEKTIKWIIKWWIDKNKLQQLPIVALGASSGGYFVSALAVHMRFNSITLMIAEGVFDSINITKNYPPTLFLHMPKDRRRMESIKQNMGKLTMKGVFVKEVRCMEFALTPHFLSDRITQLDPSFSIQFFELLHHKGFIDDRGYMRRDGRAIPWKKILKETHLSAKSYQWINHIQEELNLAYGYHEMTSLQSDDILGWFELHLSASEA